MTTAPCAPDVRPVERMRAPVMAAWPPAWRRAAAALSVLWLATAAGALLTFVAQVLLARALMPEAFGRFSAALAAVTMLAPMAGFGLPQLWLRVYGAEGWAASRWLRPSLRFVLFTAAGSLALLLAWSAVVPAEQGRVLWCLLPVVPGTLAIGLVSSKLRLEEDTARLAGWQVSQPASRVLAALALLALHQPTAVMAAMAYGAAALAVSASGWVHLRRMLAGRWRLHGHGDAPDVPATAAPAVREVWRLGWAYGAVALLYPVFFQVGTVMLAAGAGGHQAALYAIGLNVMMAVYLIPATVYQKFLLSKLHRWAVHAPDTFRRVYRQGNRMMLLGGAGCGLLVALLAPWAVRPAFGAAYAGAVPVLCVLAACAPLRFLSMGVASALLDERQARRRVVIMGACTAVVVVLNLCLVPRYQAVGTAMATVGGEVALLVGSWMAVHRDPVARAMVRP